MTGSCCGPRRGADRTSTATVGPALLPASRATSPARTGIPGGHFLMGNDGADARPGDGEGPVRRVSLSPFALGATTVTVADFAEFVADTGYRTDSERIGWSFVFAGHLAGTARRHVLPVAVAGTPWWLAVEGATWAAPYGPGSSVEDLQDHPVVHVSWHDATAYASWIGGWLPTEAQWEYAARGGLDRARYPWGDELLPQGQHRCNIWQGDFPTFNRGDDGFQATAPAASFEPNGYGLFNMVGNVWEWCADWFGTTWHADESPGTRADPIGPEDGTERVIRGGSHLCHRSYCDRYRVAARTGNTPDSASSHTGFRVAGPMLGG